MKLGSGLILGTILVPALSLIALTVSSGSGGTRLSQLSKADANLQSAFASALKNVEEIRKINGSTELQCTQFFPEFYRYQQIEPYISFFDSIEVPVLTADMNQRHYAYFEINFRRLWSLGYR